MAREAGQVAAGLRLGETNTLSSNTCGDNETGLLSDENMLTIWQRLADLYGHRFTSNYGEAIETVEDDHGNVIDSWISSTVETWRRALHGVTPKQVGDGLRKCVEKAEEWPPNAGQFRERCKPYRDPAHRPIDTRRYRQVELQRASRETANHYLAEIRGMNRGQA